MELHESVAVTRIRCSSPHMKELLSVTDGGLE